MLVSITVPWWMVVSEVDLVLWSTVEVAPSLFGVDLGRHALSAANRVSVSPCSFVISALVHLIPSIQERARDD